MIPPPTQLSVRSGPAGIPRCPGLRSACGAWFDCKPMLTSCRLHMHQTSSIRSTEPPFATACIFVASCQADVIITPLISCCALFRAILHQQCIDTLREGQFGPVAWSRYGLHQPHYCSQGLSWRCMEGQGDCAHACVDRVWPWVNGTMIEQTIT